MNEQIKVNLKKQIDDSYNIFIGSNLLSEISLKIHEIVKANKYVIISDSNVYQIYGKTVEKSFFNNNHIGLEISFKAGEESKTRETKKAIEDELIKNKVGRDSCIIALGGGVTGDMAGFVAATYRRGIPFVQIPTTLLSQIDSSIGGKVAVDTSLAKNMIGAFYQPKAVFIDVSTLKSLPADLQLNGIAETIKHGIIMDEKYFDFIEKNVSEIKNLNEETMISLIKRSCEIKVAIVEKDEKENGLRQILNFGHTIGHAVETLTNYRFLHDKCVAIGIFIESTIANEIGVLNTNDFEKIKNILLAYNLPVTIPKNISHKEIIEKTFLDKKVKHNKVKYVLPTKIGEVEYGIDVDEKIIRKVFEKLN